MCPPMIACAIILRPFMEGLTFFHFSRDLCTLSIVSSHRVVSLTLFPIQAPRERTASPSLAILMFWSSGFRSLGFTFRVSITHCRCCCVPIGMISVFSMLNFAPDTWHQSVSIAYT